VVLFKNKLCMVFFCLYLVRGTRRSCFLIFSLVLLNRHSADDFQHSNYNECPMIPVRYGTVVHRSGNRGTTVNETLYYPKRTDNIIVDHSFLSGRPQTRILCIIENYYVCTDELALDEFERISGKINIIRVHIVI
jgi:hypothetical protein